MGEWGKKKAENGTYGKEMLRGGITQSNHWMRPNQGREQAPKTSPTRSWFAATFLGEITQRRNCKMVRKPSVWDTGNAGKKVRIKDKGRVLQKEEIPGKEKKEGYPEKSASEGSRGFCETRPKKREESIVGPNLRKGRSKTKSAITGWKQKQGESQRNLLS